MLDSVAVLSLLFFFVASLLYLHGCGRLKGRR